MFARFASWVITAVSAFFRGIGGQRCRFYPSCSSYAHQALETHGFFVALKKIGRRLMRCHPFSSGGYDPVLKDS